MSKALKTLVDPSKKSPSPQGRDMRKTPEPSKKSADASKSAQKPSKKLPKLPLVLAVLCLLIASGLALTNYLNARHLAETANSLEDLKALANPRAVTSGRSVSQDFEIIKTNPFPALDKIDLLSVDFSQLKNLNPDTVAYLSLAGTNLSAPVVQASSDDYYKYHDFYRQSNASGWVALSNKNASDLSDRSNVILIHGTSDSSLTSESAKILENGWLSDRANFLIQTVTTNEKAANWQIFAAHIVENEVEDLRTEFEGGTAMVDYANAQMKLSTYSFNTELADSDRILTLSIAYSDSERLDIFAKLIKSN